MKRVLVTGSSGLVGSETVRHFDALGYEVVGVDNNMRRGFFGDEGDTSWNLQWLQSQTQRFRHQNIDIRSRRAVGQLLSHERFDAIVHCAAQPSSSFARERPYDDFDINATGTMNLLEAARQACPESPFVLLSTNKVYGNAPSEWPLVELATRYDYAHPEHRNGINESCRIDQCNHGIFGASKAAADLMTQEYGRSFNMPTCVFRNAYLTGSRHAGVQQHGLLSYLTRVAIRGDRYTIVGHMGKQVQDQLHAFDVVQGIDAFIRNPRTGEVYNLGGGRENSVSILECIDRLETMTGRTISTDYQPVANPEEPKCYITDLARFRSHYPRWTVSRSLDDILDEMVRAEHLRAESHPQVVVPSHPVSRPAPPPGAFIG